MSDIIEKTAGDWNVHDKAFIEELKRVIERAIDDMTFLDGTVGVLLLKTKLGLIK